MNFIFLIIAFLTLKTFKESKFGLTQNESLILYLVYFIGSIFMPSWIFYGYWVMLILGVIDIKYQEIPWFSYYYTFAWIIFALKVPMSYFVSIIILYLMFRFIDLIAPITMGGADIKYLLILVPVLPTQTWTMFFLILSFTSLVTFCIYALIHKTIKNILFPLLPAIFISFILIQNTLL